MVQEGAKCVHDVCMYSVCMNNRTIKNRGISLTRFLFLKLLGLVE